MKIAVNTGFFSRKFTDMHKISSLFTHEFQQYAEKKGINYSVYNINKSINSQKVNYINCSKIFSSHIDFLWNQMLLSRQIKKKYASFLLNFGDISPFLIVKNQASMIYDMSIFENQTGFSKLFLIYYKFILFATAKKSAFIMTLSEFSKQKIIKYLKINPNNVIVLPLWLKDAFVKEMFQPISMDKDSYILTVSSLDPRKNYHSLLRAFLSIGNKYVNCFSVSDVSDNFLFDPEMMNYRNYPHISFLGKCTDSELIKLYKKALCFCSVSFYEGFSMHALEAMSCGCPLLLSDIPVHREICDDAALYVNPHDLVDIQKKINLLIHDEDLRNYLIIKGKARIKYFHKPKTLSILWDKLQEYLF